MIWTFIVLIGLHVLLFSRVNMLKSRHSNQSSEAVYTILIPARNEQHNLITLLPTVLGQELVKEVIVINDQSTDKTREVAESFGATVIDTPPLPQNWMGKSWALWNGVNYATGNHFIFLDADTWLKPEAIKKIDTAFSKQRYQGAMSIQPYHEMKNWKERFSILFHFITAASTGSTQLFRSKDSTVGGYGQALVMNRNTYIGIGGHEAIHEEVVENLALIQQVKSRNLPVQAYIGKDIIHMRMYPNGWSELVNGWSKSFAKGAMMTNSVMLFLISIWLTFYFTAAMEIFHITDQVSFSIWATFMLSYSFLFWMQANLFGKMKWTDMFLIPLFFFGFLYIFTRSVWNGVFNKKRFGKTGRLVEEIKKMGWVGLVLYWGCCQLLIALWSSSWSYSAIRRSFSTNKWLYPNDREKSLYQKLRISKWKDILPDAGGWFSSSQSKKTVKRDEINSFFYETVRAEQSHWLQILPVFPFFWMNDTVLLCWMVLYGVLVNVPFIFIQRYNRARILPLLKRSIIR
ncbi:glycosyltransferase [Mangrovibacillus cuniculi]|uniref:4,4'-diaponeurosporenoate glycosyltransferase n=1 Tax=Mangrovibacillus cuniculi TaxID=2593652 RepID=A0A7S8CAS3_9BACI|nr:glycosyltransferase [Mangrovibacillus cuniculi]QPC46539.1 glycosyltransferase [Mangrovibacillus cuniculi]